jgi:iron complex outermembrane recepter protein
MPHARSKLATAITALVLASAIAPSHAQKLEEIIVTAQKREQGLGDVPLSIQVVSGEALRDQDIFSFKGLVEQLPNVTLDTTPGVTVIRMRGIGTGGENSAAEQAVGMYIDGVYVSRGYQFNAPFTDIERVEILKGPQGVLQGKNSVAGAVVITTRRPTEEFEAIARGSYEMENEGYNIEGIVSGPLTDNLFGRLVAQQNLVGGWLDTNTRLAANGITELEGKNDQNEDEFYVVRASTVWDASDTLSMFAKVETGQKERKGVHFGGLAIQPGAVGPGGLPIIEEYRLQDANYGFITDGVASNGFITAYNEDLNLFEATNQTYRETIESNSFTFQFDWETNLGTVTGISSYSDFEVDVASTLTMAPFDWLTGVSPAGKGGEEFDAFTQELRLVSPGGATIDYVIGAFYMDRTIKMDGRVGNGMYNFSNGGLGLPPEFDFASGRYFKEDTDAWSVFGQVTWNILETLRLNAGLRYTDETKKAHQDLAVEFLVESPVNQLILNEFGTVPFTTEDMPRDEVSETNTDPSLSLQWDVTDGVMLYASYTEATKAGGFNSTANRPADTSYDPETAKGYEIGMKGSFLDGRLFTSAAIFHTEFDDLQVSSLDAATNSFFFANAAKATTEGFEADFRLAATQGLELGGAIGYADSSYDDFPGGNCSVGSSREPDCDPVTNTRNQAGDKLVNAPEWTGNLFADYRYQLSNGMEIGLRGTIVYSDDFYINGQNDPYLQQDDFTKLDLVASLSSADGAWRISVVGKNVTDKTTVSFGGGTPIFEGAYWSNVDTPRQIFLNAEYRWF